MTAIKEITVEYRQHPPGDRRETPTVCLEAGGGPLGIPAGCPLSLQDGVRRAEGPDRRPHDIEQIVRELLPKEQAAQRIYFMYTLARVE